MFLMRIFTGSYEKCDFGNFVSISGDKGNSVGYDGNVYTKLAPKKEFWEIWHSNIDKISEEENNKYYMEEYYKQVLSKLDAKEVVKELEEQFGNNVILLCYEEVQEFCHRHLVATWLEKELGIEVPEILIDKDLKIERLNRNQIYVQQFKEIMDDIDKEKNEVER